jgi:hypothetical protein
VYLEISDSYEYTLTGTQINDLSKGMYGKVKVTCSRPFVFFLVGLGFELRALCLLSSTLPLEPHHQSQ